MGNTNSAIFYIVIKEINNNEYAVHMIIDINIKFKKIIESVAYSSQGSHIGQLDFCNSLADGSTTG